MRPVPCSSQTEPLDVVGLHGEDGLKARGFSPEDKVCRWSRRWFGVTAVTRDTEPLISLCFMLDLWKFECRNTRSPAFDCEASVRICAVVSSWCFHAVWFPAGQQGPQTAQTPSPPPAATTFLFLFVLISSAPVGLLYWLNSHESTDQRCCEGPEPGRSQARPETCRFFRPVSAPQWLQCSCRFILTESAVCGDERKVHLHLFCAAAASFYNVSCLVFAPHAVLKPDRYLRPISGIKEIHSGYICSHQCTETGNISENSAITNHLKHLCLHGGELTDQSPHLNW